VSSHPAEDSAAPCGVKIVCTLGPASSDPATLRELARAGMDVARLNFSHGTLEEHAARLAALRAVERETGRPLAVLQDLPGPKLRIDAMQPDTHLRTGDAFGLRRGTGVGDARQAFVDDAYLFEEIEPGDRLLLADGAVELEVREVEAQGARCRVLAGGPLSSRKGINAPRGLLKRPLLGERDRAALRFGAAQGVDYVCVSFVRGVADLDAVRDELEHHGAHLPLVAKIETAPAIENLEAIVERADAVLVARGDLALETPFERVPLVQKRVIETARRHGRPVITATQMLASMVKASQPTRAEVNDVANAVLDGSDALMLSEETAVGDHPARAVATMARIARAAAASRRAALHGPDGLPEEMRDLAVMAESAARAAQELGARGILAWTRSGLGPRLLSRAAPGLAIVAPTADARVARSLALVRDVLPIHTAGPEVEPERVLAALGVRPEEAGRLVLVGHEPGPRGQRIPWIRVAPLEEPGLWRRDPLT
jgi:pyruvate kinase